MEQQVHSNASLSTAKITRSKKLNKDKRQYRVLPYHYLNSMRESKNKFTNRLKSSSTLIGSESAKHCPPRRQQLYNDVSQESTSTAHINHVHDPDSSHTTHGTNHIIPVSSLQSPSVVVDPIALGTSTSYGSVNYSFRDKYSARINIPDIPVSRMRLRVVAIDCEMVGCIKEGQLAEEPVGKMCPSNRHRTLPYQINTGANGSVLKVKPPKKKRIREVSIAARCSIIDYNGSLLFEKYINPAVETEYKIRDYRTPWSGIRPCNMVGATPFYVAREEIMRILKDCIVVGHSIWTDFHSLEIYNFPSSQIRDTSLHPKLKMMAGLPVNQQPGALKKMTLILLNRHIQTNAWVGHCSFEDATATMDLYKLVEQEWEK